MIDADLLKRLEQADLAELRHEWGRRCGVVPRLRSPDLLRRILAWHIQTAAHGGLDRATRRMLAGHAAGPESLMADGTVIAREWKGVRHEVEIAGTGFLYNGERWQSLSEVARAITGTRWNGPRFFGLRQAA